MGGSFVDEWGMDLICRKYWHPPTTPLQTVLDSIVDASANKPYEIIIPPGRYALPANLPLKSFVSFRGFGGRNRITILTGGVGIGVQQFAVNAAAGVSRISMTGIRFESLGVALNFSTDATKTLVLELDDVSMDGTSPFSLVGFSNANRNICWRAKNSDFAGNDVLTYAQGDFKASELDFNTFFDSEFDFWNCVFPNAGTLATNVGSTNGLYRFKNCAVGRTVDNEVAESLISVFARATESVYWYGGPLLGASNPNTLAQLTGLTKGTLYVDTAGGLWVKTTAIGVNTWVVQA